jgi:hypothetical protein
MYCCRECCKATDSQQLRTLVSRYEIRTIGEQGNEIPTRELLTVTLTSGSFQAYYSSAAVLYCSPATATSLGETGKADPPMLITFTY